MLSLYTGEHPYPRKASATPRLTDEQQQQVKTAPTPAPLDLSRAPQILPEWVGRAELLTQIAEDYLNHAVRITGLIGFGGEGKTSLARKALDAILNSADRPAAVFWWSFYEQRSSDEFFEAALTYLGGAAMAKSAPSAAMRAGMLGGLLSTKRCVFVLDGFEVMQHDEGDDFGLIVSSALRDFLGLFASPFHNSFCLITSRAPLVDLLAHTTYRQRDVTRLSEADGHDLLKAIGIHGIDTALDRVVQQWDGHALTLSLIGSYLVEHFGGDVGKIDNLPSPAASDDHYARVGRVLRRYDEHLSESQRAFMLIFSAFRLPVRETAFGKVFRAETIKYRADTLERLFESTPRKTKDVAAAFDPNTPLIKMDDIAFKSLVDGMVTRRLIRPVMEADGVNAYSAHPLIRAHYFERLERGGSAATHHQIADYYQTVASEKLSDFPTLNELTPYFEIVHHLCRAGAYDAGSRVHWERIHQRNKGVLIYQFGAYETELGLLNDFFPGNDLTRDPAVSRPADKRFILNEVGLCLMNLGQLHAAVPFYERSNLRAKSTKNWYNASIGSLNLAELYLSLGELRWSVKEARIALGLASRVIEQNDRRQDERLSRAYLAWALHQSGNLAQCTAQFARAEALQHLIYSDQQYLDSAGGIWHAQHLRRAGDTAYARRVNNANLSILVHNGWQYQISQCYRIFGDLDAEAGDSNSAYIYYEQALSIARSIQRRDVLVEALLARGRWYAKYMSDALSAFDDLYEAFSYCGAGSYRIYEADILIALAWAHLRVGSNKQGLAAAERAKSESVSMGYHWGQVDADEVLAALG